LSNDFILFELYLPFILHLHISMNFRGICSSANVKRLHLLKWHHYNRRLYQCMRWREFHQELDIYRIMKWSRGQNFKFTTNIAHWPMVLIQS